MGALHRVRTTLGVAILALAAVALAPPSVSAEQAQASLRISPGVYVGGQRLTFEGNIGRLGVRRIRLQIRWGTPGALWNEPEREWHGWTKGDGSFRFHYPAPAMFGLHARVATAGAVTPSRPVTARSQDLGLTVVPDNPQVGENFAIEVDTTPTFMWRGDLPGPAFQGRTLTLQQRVGGNGWKTLGTTTTDAQGQGRFQETAAAPGIVVYRVRQEDWFADGNQIGWFPSFPTYVRVGGAGASAARTTQQRSARTAAAGTTERSQPVSRVDSSDSASQTHGWGRALWDFGFAFGESLTSPPYRGSDLRGRWLDTSNGSGRAVPHNGQLILDSQRNHLGSGDFGTTAATLRGNPMRYGRWEVKLWLKTPENDARDYRVSVELVPDRRPDSNCGVITVADVAAHQGGVTVGARALRSATRWTYRKRLTRLTSASAAFAVEMTRRHISWFVNGRVIATVRSPAAVPDVPMTLRMSMKGKGEATEMNRTTALSDWQRAFPLKNGKLSTGGHALRRGTYGGC